MNTTSSFTFGEKVLLGVASAVVAVSGGMFAYESINSRRTEDPQLVSVAPVLDLEPQINQVFPLEIPLEPSLAAQTPPDLFPEDSYITRCAVGQGGIEIQVKIPFSDYLLVRAQNHNIQRLPELGRFLTPHPLIGHLARELTWDASSPEDRAQRILDYVHNSVIYDNLLESPGHKDYVRHPLETIVEGNGDCEDQALLAAALSRSCGLDVVLVYFYPSQQDSFDAHLGYAVAGSFQGASFRIGGQNYFYAESTGTTFLNAPSRSRIGDISEIFASRMIDVFVPAPPSSP
ncbi:transglutaminase domain-containing protein [Candidatus Woesearchaeota archaeon]|nr:transglutaminase domain-containing protein [Candidatus Woesearchaeota archaeon]